MTDPDSIGYVPTFSPKTRTAVYVGGVIVSFASFITAGSAAVVMADPTAVVTIAALVGSGFGTMAAAFGVGYRPTR